MYQALFQVVKWHLHGAHLIEIDDTLFHFALAEGKAALHYKVIDFVHEAGPDIDIFPQIVTDFLPQFAGVFLCTRSWTGCTSPYLGNASSTVRSIPPFYIKSVPSLSR